MARRDLPPDPRFPGRPQHPDMATLSHEIRQFDAQADEQVEISDIVGGLVDLDSLLYLIDVRLRLMQAKFGLPVLFNHSLIMAAYLEAFCLGVQFQKAGGHES